MTNEANTAMGPERALIADRLAAYTVSESRRARLGDEHFELPSAVELSFPRGRETRAGRVALHRLFGHWGHPPEVSGTEA